MHLKKYATGIYGVGEHKLPFFIFSSYELKQKHITGIYYQKFINNLDKISVLVTFIN